MLVLPREEMTLPTVFLDTLIFSWWWSDRGSAFGSGCSWLSDLRVQVNTMVLSTGGNGEMRCDLRPSNEQSALSLSLGSDAAATFGRPPRLRSASTASSRLATLRCRQNTRHRRAEAGRP